MMAVSGSLPHDDHRYGFEIKWDGVRAITYASAGRVRVESRNLLDITPRYPEVVAVADALAGRHAVLDGEVVAFDERGRPNFGLLQQRMHVGDVRGVLRRMRECPVVYVIFDILWLDGAPLVREPYAERRRVLDGLGLSGPSWQVPAYHVGDGAAMLAASRERDLEGVLAKRLDSPYEPGKRSRGWIKVKNTCRQEVVVGGWLEGAGNRSKRIGALLVGVYESGSLRYVGKVGTGYTERMLDALLAQLRPLERPSSPFANKVPYRAARYIEPQLVAEVEFTEWTREGNLRHPSFKGLRTDKRPEDVVRET